MCQITYKSYYGSQQQSAYFWHAMKLTMIKANKMNGVMLFTIIIEACQLKKMNSKSTQRCSERQTISSKIFVVCGVTLVTYIKICVRM